MDGYDASTYGERIADRYDDIITERTSDPDACVSFLADLAGGGPALELAIGTGRIAVPLAARGVAVSGVDISPAMVERLRAKPGGDAIPVTMGDFADVPVDGRFPLVYLVVNTLFALLTQDDQVRCFANVAEHLSDDGIFVIECFVPDVGRFDRGQRVHVMDIGVDSVSLSVSKHDPLTQVVTSQEVTLRNDGTRLDPVVVRYAWPAELDLMARLAGLRLRERWADWARTPFTANSASHVSVYAPEGSSKGA
jgi:SAM-dependent methyltransferase